MPQGFGICILQIHFYAMNFMPDKALVEVDFLCRNYLRINGKTVCLIGVK
jgi:hypothetical protein